MDMNIGLHTLKVAGLFVSRRRGGWIIELMPGMVWSKKDRWILEPSDKSATDEEEPDCLFPLEEAVEIAIKVSSEQQGHPDKKADKKPEPEYEDEEDGDEEEDEDEIESECQSCHQEDVGNICRVALQIDFPLPLDNRLGDNLLGRASFTGPFFVCKPCFLDFINYYLENHIGRKEKDLKEDLNFIADLLHNDRPLIQVDKEDIQRMLTTMARIYYPMLIWTQLKSDGRLP